MICVLQRELCTVLSVTFTRCSTSHKLTADWTTHYKKTGRVFNIYKNSSVLVAMPYRSKIVLKRMIHMYIFQCCKSMGNLGKGVCV